MYETVSFSVPNWITVVKAQTADYPAGIMILILHF